MNYDLAKAIAAAYAPDLYVDPPNAAMPALFVVRKSPNGSPHSIHLDNIDASLYPPIAPRDAVAAIPALAPTDDHPGHPEIPAQPAFAGRSTEGQIAQAEQTNLKFALDSARKLL